MLRIAALIFLVTGLAYLAWDAALTLAHGVRAGTLFMALVSVALIYQGYALFVTKTGARLSGLISAVIVAGTCAYIASQFILLPLPQSIFLMPSDVQPVFFGVAAVAVAFAVAAALIAFSKPWRPNPAVNSDAPPAGLRPRGGPPVT